MSESDQLHRLEEEVNRLRADNERLRTLLALSQRTPSVLSQKRPTQAVLSSGPASSSEKVALIRDLFRGREDVYAVRWENARMGKSGYVPAVAGGWSRHGPKSYLPLSAETLARHLRGKESIGVYPLLTDDSCWFLAIDLDGKTWRLDALALLEAASEVGVDVALERSRSGEGGHVWVFFAETVAASAARRLGAVLLREAMRRRGELDLASYDRLFPNQDFLPAKGFGNLIALPLQGRCRAGGTSVFLDPVTLEPWTDQWAFLQSLERVSRDALDRVLSENEEVAFGIEALPSRRTARQERMPAKVRCAVGSGLAVAKADLPSSLMTDLKHLASLHNPLFYERQRLRLSTYQTPRLIRCYEEDLTHLHLPRGLLTSVNAAVAIAGSRLELDDRRPIHTSPLAFEFCGELTALQREAVATLLEHDDGVLVAPPGTGKTVIACALISERQQPTLVLAHSKPLLEQWRSQLQDLLGLQSKHVGQLGGGRRKRTGIVDLAMIQSLKALDDLDSFFGDYGLIVVDECHHLPAVSFEAAVRHASARHFLGLTATPYRRDGLQDMVIMQCGPIRHRIDRSETPASEINLELTVRRTDVAIADPGDTPVQEVFRLLVEDENRTALIRDDVLSALAEGRRCLILSQWKQHCQLLAEAIRSHGVSPIILEGGLGKRARSARLEEIENTSPHDDLVVIATGQYLGEGFDCPQLDTLFLAFPVSFKGRLVQYTGRLMRSHPTKSTVRIYDYADIQVPVLRAMHTRRLRTYKSLGFLPGVEQPDGVASEVVAAA